MVISRVKTPAVSQIFYIEFIFFISAEINERNKIIPPAAYANKHSSSDDEDSDFKDVLIPHESGTTQVCYKLISKCLLVTIADSDRGNVIFWKSRRFFWMS